MKWDGSMPKKRASDKPVIAELPLDLARSELDKPKNPPQNSKGEMIENLMLSFENAAHEDERGEFWLARELSPLLGYKDYRNFLNAVDKAKEACAQVGEAVEDHFGDVTEMVALGSGAERAVADIQLTRFACYIIAQNGDPSKRPEIAAAQTYFAIQTRRQELSDLVSRDLTDDQKRVLLRDKLKEHNSALAESAQTAGVTNFRNFNGAGLKGLYGGFNQAQILRRKQLPDKVNHLDYAGHEELAANYFKATQTEARLKREGNIGQRRAENVHRQVGEAIHDLIESQGNTVPEDQAAQDHIKEARKRIKSTVQKKIEKK